MQKSVLLKPASKTTTVQKNRIITKTLYGSYSNRVKKIKALISEKEIAASTEETK